MRKIFSVPLFCIAVDLFSGTCSAAKPAHVALPSYASQQQKIDENWSILRVFDRKTGHTIWRRKCCNVGTVAWSRDHRALAVDIYNLAKYPKYSGQFRLLYWRAGEAVHLVSHPGLFQDFDEIGGDLTWSPDDRRFAFRAGGMATPYGTLCCVDAETGRFYFGPASVDTYHWVGSRRLRYVVVEIQNSDKRNPDGSTGSWVTRKPREWSGRTTSQVWLKAWADPAWRDRR